MSDSVGTASITIVADTKNFDRDVDKSTKKAQKSIGDRLGAMGKAAIGGLSAVGNVMTLLTGSIGFAVPALGVAASALSAVAAGGLQLGAALGPVVAQLGAAGLAVKVGLTLAVKQAQAVFSFAMTGMTIAAGATAKEIKAQLKTLPPAAQDTALAMKDVQDKMVGLRKTVQQHVFAGLAPDLTKLSGTYFPLVTKAAAGTGGVFNTLAKQGAAMVNSGPWKKDFQTVTHANNVNLGLMGGIVLHLANVLRNLLVTSLPLTHRLLEWVSGLAKTGDTMTETGRKTGKLRQFFHDAGNTASQLGTIAKKLFDALKNIFDQAKVVGPSKDLLDTIQHLAGNFKRWTESTKGTQFLADFFKQGQKNLTAIEKLVKAVGSAFGGIAKGADKNLFADSLNQIRKEILPPIVRLLNNANSSGAFSSLITAAGKVIAIVAQMEKGDSSLKAFARALGFFADAILWLMQNVPGASKAISIFFTVMGTMKAVNMVGLGGAVSKLGGLLLSLTEKLLGGTVASQANAAATLENAAAQEAEYAASVRGRLASIAKTAVEKAGALATKAMAGAQWLLNAAMDANPITLVVIALVALVAIFIIAYKKSDTFRAIVNAAFQKVQDIVGGVIDWFKTAIPDAFNAVLDFLKAHWMLILAIIGGPIVAAVLLIIKNWDTIKAATEAAWNWVKTAIGNVVDWIKSVPGRVWGFLQGMWDKAMHAAAVVHDFIVNQFLKVLDWLKGLPGRVWNVISNVWTKYLDASAKVHDFVVGVFVKIIDWLKGLPGKIWGVLSNLWDRELRGIDNIKAHAIDIFTRLVGWITGLPGKMAKAGKGMFDFIKDEIKGALATVVDLWNSIDFGIHIDTHIPGVPKIDIDDLIPDVPNPFRATGGPVKAGFPYIVGEKRPELFVPDQSGRIEPRVGSSVTNNFTVYARDMNDVLTQATRMSRHKAIGGVATVGAR